MGAATRRQRRQDLLFRLYQASGSTLPYGTWLKHYHADQARAAQQSDAIVLPASFWVVVGIAVTCVLVSAAVIGRAAGWW